MEDHSVVVYPLLAGLFLLLGYLWHVNRALNGTPKHIEELAVKPFTKDEITRAYDDVKKNGLGFEKALPPKTGRRYVVTGGTGTNPLALLS